MRTRCAILFIAAGALFPLLAHGAGITSALDKKDMSMRRLIAAELNRKPASVTRRGAGTFLPSRITGAKTVNVSPGATTIWVDFMASARVRVKAGGKTRSVYQGGCTGSCTIQRTSAGAEKLTDVRIAGPLVNIAH